MFKRWLSIRTDKSCLISGPRRCGKTTFLKNNFKDWKYVTLDDLDFYSWAKKDPKGFVESLGSSAIIDEIQRIPDLIIAVKYSIDSKKSVFLMTGSSLTGLFDRSAETLAGRINLYSLPTVCWGENFGFKNHDIFKDQLNQIEIQKAKRLLDRAINYGQFPEILCQQDDQEKKFLLKNYKDTYFTRDLMRLSNIENLDGLLSIINNVAKSIGSHLDISNFSRESNLSFVTTKKYLNSLFNSELIFKLYGYQYGPAKRYIKAVKTYYSDNGIISSLNVPLNTGQLLENFVIAELEKRRKLGLIKADQFFYYKTSSGTEIDLIFNAENIIYAIEIKSNINPGKKDIRNLRNFTTKENIPVKRFLFYPGTEYKMIDNVKLIPVAALFRG